MTSQPAAKILFVDMESPLGHMDVNHFFIRQVFPHFTNYYYMVERDLYENMLGHYPFHKKPAGVFFPEQQKRSIGKISTRMRNFRKVRYILDFIRKKDISLVYFLSYDTLSLSCYVNKFSGYKVILMNHDNIARFIRNPLRRFFLKRLKKVIHVVYSCRNDTSILSRLQQKLGFEEVVQIEYHIDESRNIIYNKPYNPLSVFLYAPSNGNDNDKILRLLRSLEGSTITVKAKVTDKIYYRHQERYGENMFFGFLGNDVFERNMNAADFILLLYPDDYIFRTSGILFDAMAYGKPVITDNRFLFETYLEKSGLGIYVDDALVVGKTISRISEAAYGRLVENIQNYKRSYSAEKIGRDFALKIHRIMER